MNLSIIPFSYHHILSSLIGNKTKTILDLGCSNGGLMADICEERNWKIYGVELDDASYKQAVKKNIYTKVIRGDVRKLPSLPLKKFDVVFASQVLEHLKKNEGTKCLSYWEGLAKKRIIVSTTIGYMKYNLIEKGVYKNPLQKHISGWSPYELVERGYKVRGQGLKLIYGKKGIARKIPLHLFFIISFIGWIFSPLVYFYPKLGTYMIAWKDV